MAIIGKLAAVLSLNTSGFTSGLSKSKQSLGGFSTSIDKSMGSIVRFGKAMVAAAAGGGLIYLVRQSMQAIDSMGKFAGRLGMTTEALSRLQYAAKLSGVATTTLDMGLQRMTRRVAEAAQGTGEAQAAIAELGLDARALSQLPIEQQFFAIADAMKGVQGDADLVRLAFKMFDSEGVALVNMLKAGTAQMKAMGRESDAAGNTINTSTYTAVMRANDAMTTLQASINGLVVALVDRLAEPLEAITNKIAVFARSLKFLSDESLRALAADLKWAAGLLALLVILPKVVVAIVSIVKALQGLAKASAIVQALSGPAGWVAVTVSLVGVAVVAAELDSRFDDMSAAMAQASEEAQSTALTTDQLASSMAGLGTAIDKSSFDGFTEGVTEANDALRGTNNELDKMRSYAEQVFEQTRTPMEKYRAELDQLFETYWAGLIDQDTYRRGLQQAHRALLDVAVPGWDAEPTKMAEAAKRGSPSYGQIERAYTSIGGVGRAAKMNPADAEAPKQTNFLASIDKKLGQGVPARAT